MPWIYNSTRDVHPVELQDGSSYGFLPRKKVYIQPEKMSAEVWRLVHSGKLANHGGDPVAAPPAPPQSPPVKVEIEPAKPVTSSTHHSASASFAIDSSIADNGEKESKAVKKQDDDLEKATSDKSEADLKSNDTRKTEKRRDGFRRRP